MPLRNSLLALLLLAAPAFAILDRPIALQGILDKIPLIFVCEVDKVDAEKGTAVFLPKEDLKGKAEFERIPVNLKDGVTAAGKKADHTKVMLERLAPGRKLILFAKKDGDEYLTYGYVEGTWFQLSGTVDSDKKTVRWAFLNCEPNLRGTFKGTTDELRKLATEVLAKKAKAPEPDPKEKPGFGPTVEEDKRPQAMVMGGALFGVIPSAVFVAPLAILAAIFPTTFSGLAGGFKRWRAFMVVVSINGTLAAIYFFIRKYLPDSWWAGTTAFTSLLLAVVFLGFVWSGQRYRRAVVEEATASDPPTRRDVFALLGFAGGTLLLIFAVVFIGQWIVTGSAFATRLSEIVGLLFELPTRELTAGMIGLLAAALYLAYRSRVKATEPEISIKMRAAGETMALGAMLLFGAVMLVLGLPRSSTANAKLELGDVSVNPDEAAIKLEDAELWFESPNVEVVYSGLHVTPTRIYFGGLKSELPLRGAVVCVDRASKQQKWVFSEPGLRTVYSTPVEQDGKLYFGEGLHTDPNCRLFCLDAESGAKLWERPTTSHTEGAPVVVNGKVYFSAGDDGLYCITTGNEDVWQHRGRERKLHVDTPVLVAGGKVFAGSGYQTFAAFALNAETGEELWKRELPLRSFGQPLLMGNRLYYGLGTGALLEDLSREPEPGRPSETVPAGMIVCLNPDSGEVLWQTDLPKSAHTQLSGDGKAIYAACRDGGLYALDRFTGKRIWKFEYTTPLSTGTAIVTYSKAKLSFAVYTATPEGNVSAHEPSNGKIIWSRNLGEITGREVSIQGAPTAMRMGTWTGREVLVPVTLTNKNNGDKRAGIARFTDRVTD